MIKNLQSRLLIVFACVLLLLGIYLFLPKNQISGNAQDSKVGLLNTVKQKTLADFKKKQKDYSYVSFDNLSEWSYQKS